MAGRSGGLFSPPVTSLLRWPAANLCQCQHKAFPKQSFVSKMGLTGVHTCPSGQVGPGLSGVTWVKSSHTQDDIRSVNEQ